MSLCEIFFEHWKSIPRTGLVPSLGDYLDRPHPTTQPWTVIFDVEGEHLPMRLVGTLLTGAVGVELKGINAHDIYPEHQRADFVRRHRLITSHPCGMWSYGSAKTLKGHGIEMKGIALPLMREANQLSVVRVIELLNPLVPGDQFTQVKTDPKPITWVDIGAGVPAPSPAAT